MSEEKKLQGIISKLNMYCIHKLLWDCKRSGTPDKEIWRDLKECFQSGDYGLDMELRPVDMLWGDTNGINEYLESLKNG